MTDRREGGGTMYVCACVEVVKRVRKRVKSCDAMSASLACGCLHS